MSVETGAAGPAANVDYSFHRVPLDIGEELREREREFRARRPSLYNSRKGIATTLVRAHTLENGLVGSHREVILYELEPNTIEGFQQRTRCCLPAHVTG